MPVCYRFDHARVRLRVHAGDAAADFAGGRAVRLLSPAA